MSKLEPIEITAEEFPPRPYGAIEKSRAAEAFAKIESLLASGSEPKPEPSENAELRQFIRSLIKRAK